jgi:centractin
VSSFVGNVVEEHRGAMKLSYPIEHGIVTDWDDMERVWRYIYSDSGLGVPVEEHPVRGVV